MAIFKQKTFEEAERERVKRNVRYKSFLTAAGCGAVIYLLFAANGHWLNGLWRTPLLSFVIMLVSRVFYSRHENAESAKRLQLAEAKRLSEQQAEQTAQARKALQEQARLQEMRATAEKERAALDERRRRDNREYILKKLSNTNTYIDLYDPVNSEDCARIRQNIAKELTDILVKHPRTELSTIIAQEPEVGGMLTELEKRLFSKGIDSMEAAQLLAARSGEANIPLRP